MTLQNEENQQALFDISIYKALYLKEARKCLVTLQQSLTRLRGNANDSEAVREAHRAAHTLKGMSATMRYDALVAVAETLEEPLRRADQANQSLALEQIAALLVRCDDFGAGLDQLAAAEEDEDSL